MIDKIIIFGAGRLGRAAYYYYLNKKEIECFIDNRESLWNTCLEGIPVCAPDILKRYDLREIRVVIAIKDGWKQIQEQLYHDYRLRKSILFGIEENLLDIPKREAGPACITDEIIIHYSGGLGNQMFQYALASCFRKAGNRVSDDTSEYHVWESGRFELPSVFPEISVRECDETLKLLYEKSLDFQYSEAAAGKVDSIRADMQILNRRKGIIKGYWQSFRYVEFVRNELVHDFQFRKKEDERFWEIRNQIRAQNAVSVHIRRGDYLQNDDLYGGICTAAYYDKAIQYIMRQTEEIVFYFFSDDIAWAKEKYAGLSHSVFVTKALFEDYEDWYDMCLMSCCKHNIVANSTFSWWGAWLNGNPDKIVIAPYKWLNGTELPDICPPDWIRI